MGREGLVSSIVGVGSGPRRVCDGESETNLKGDPTIAATAAGAGGVGAAALRPPSYRSAWTASGASWVANGFRLPERFRRSHVSGTSTRRWFGVSDGPNLSSDGSVGTRSIRTSLNARISSMSSGSQRQSRGNDLEEAARGGMDVEVSRISATTADSATQSRFYQSSTDGPGTPKTTRTGRISQMSEVSAMSSRWSEQRSSVAIAQAVHLRPPMPGTGHGLGAKRFPVRTSSMQRRAG